MLRAWQQSSLARAFLFHGRIVQATARNKLTFASWATFHVALGVVNVALNVDDVAIMATLVHVKVSGIARVAFPANRDRATTTGYNAGVEHVQVAVDTVRH